MKSSTLTTVRRNRKRAYTLGRISKVIEVPDSFLCWFVIGLDYETVDVMIDFEIVLEVGCFNHPLEWLNLHGSRVSRFTEVLK